MRKIQFLGSFAPPSIALPGLILNVSECDARFDWMASLIG